MSEKFSIEELLAPIAGPNPCGIDISYEEEFALLRSKRNTEEEISLGIWQELKSPEELAKEDRRNIDEICEEILKNKSKNLQVCAFLIEDLVKKRNLEGIDTGLEFLMQISEKYWTQLYPKDNSDLMLDEKKKIFFWIDEKCAFSLKISALLKDEIKEDICFDDIEKINRIGRHSKNSANTEVQAKEKEYTVFIQKLHADMIQNKIILPINNILEKINHIKTFLNTTMNDKDYYFPNLTHALEDLKKFFSYKLATLNAVEEETQINESEPEKKPAEKKQKNLDGMSRNLIYQELYELALKLKETEQHSPVPDLILRAVSWKDLSFAQITNELGLQSPLITLLTQDLSKTDKT